MIEFTLNRNRNGKKSRWAKKYPRKRILKRGSWYILHLNWFIQIKKGYSLCSSKVRLQGILLLYEDCQDKGNRHRSQILGK